MKGLFLNEEESFFTSMLLV